MFKLLSANPSDLFNSHLYDENHFYEAFKQDLLLAREEVIIESPFITGNRVASLLPIFRKMRSRNIKITINTRHPTEHDYPFYVQASDAIEELQQLGAEVLFTGRLHRKIAIIDRYTLWEGSLNILSQGDSCEIMRRIESEVLARRMISFLKIDKFLR